MRSSQADRKVRAEYGRMAAKYDRIWQPYIEDSVALLCAQLPESAPQRLLDVGCGTGQLLQAVSQRYRDQSRAVGVDASWEMLVRARENQPAVAVAQAAMQRLPFPDDTFDLLLTSSALHFCPQPVDAVAELARVGRPGARLQLLDWCRDDLLIRGRMLLLRAARRSLGTVWGVAELRAILAEHRFADITISRHRLRGGSRMAPKWGVMTATATLLGR